MAEKKSSSSKAGMIGLIMLAGLGAGGYFGFTNLKDDIRAHMTRTQGVIIDLKTETIKEVRASTSKTVTEVGKLNTGLANAAANGTPMHPGTAPELKAELGELKKDLAAIQSGQQAIISQLSAQGASAISAPVAAPATIETKIVTKLIKPFRQTVYFPLNKIMAPSVDEQIKKAVQVLKDEAAGRTCDVSVHGFSDTLGGDVSNLKLSQARADYVARKLRFEDFNVTNVRAWGERRLEAITFDGVNNEKNRRVEIDLACEVKAMTPPTKPAVTEKAPTS